MKIMERNSIKDQTIAEIDNLHADLRKASVAISEAPGIMWRSIRWYRGAFRRIGKDVRRIERRAKRLKS